MRADSVLLLGNDRYLMDAFGHHGVDAVVAYGPSLRDANGLPDLAPGVVPMFVEDNSNPELVLSALARLGAEDFRPNAVLTTDELSLVTAGLLGEHFGARAIDPDVAVRFRDKSLQKQVVAAAGISTAEVRVIEDIRDLPRDMTVPTGGAVVKPISGAATRSTAMVRDRHELEAFAAQVSGSSSARTFVLETFTAGDEWTVDGLVVGGRLVFWSLATYAQPCLETVVSNKPVCMRRFDPGADDVAYGAARPVVERAVAALGLEDGAVHMELFHDRATGVTAFGECAARRGGAFVQEEVLAKHDVDLAEGYLLAALGRAPVVRPTVREEVIGTTYLPTRKGTVLARPSRAEAEALDHVLYARLEMPVGHVVTADAADTNARMGAVLLTAPTVHRFEEVVEETLAWFDARLQVVPPGMTRAQLRRRERASQPEGYDDDRLYRGARG